MFGYSPDEFGRLGIKEMLTPESYATAVQMTQKAVAERSDLKELQPWEFHLVKKDGTILDAEVRTRLVWKKGHIVGIHGITRDVTERRKTEEELRRSEERFRQVAESTGEFIWEVDAEGLYTYANPMVERILGHTPHEVVGKKHFYDFFLPEEREGLKTGALEAFARRESFHGFINSNVHRDGHIVTLETSGMPVVDDQGNLTGYRGADTDVTERKRLEEQTRQLQKQIEYVLGATKTGLDIIDSQFNIQYIDPAWKKVYGEPQGKKCYDYFMGRNEVCPGCGIVKALETKQPAVTEETLVRENNRVIQVTSTPFQNDKGEWLVAEVNVDITERKQAENRLAYLASFPERNPNPIMEVDLNGGIRYVNPAALRLFPDLHEEGLAHPWLGDWATVVRPFREGQTDTGVRDVTIGERSYEQLFHYFAQDSFIRVYGVDITERKQAEKQQTQLFQKLSEINQEFKDFALHRLARSQGSATGHPGHRRLALRPIIADKLDDQGKEYLTLLASRVDRMQDLIDGVLQYSRVGRTEQGTVPVDLGRLVPEIVDNLGVPAHIAIQSRARPADGRGGSDADYAGLPEPAEQRRQVHGQAARETSPWLAWKKTASGSSASADNGPGIEEKHFERIFKLFQTLAPAG